MTGDQMMVQFHIGGKIINYGSKRWLGALSTTNLYLKY